MDSSSGVIGNDGFANIPNVSVDPTTTRVAPRQVASGVSRGTQTIMNIDGSYVTLGLIPGTTQFGIAFFDAKGKIQSKSTASTDYKYDTNGINYYQNGLLKDGTKGLVVAKPGINVDDAISL